MSRDEVIPSVDEETNNEDTTVDTQCVMDQSSSYASEEVNKLKEMIASQSQRKRKQCRTSPTLSHDGSESEDEPPNSIPGTGGGILHVTDTESSSENSRQEKAERSSQHQTDKGNRARNRK